MKKLISILLVLTMSAAFMTVAFAEGDEGSVVVGFDELRDLVMDGNASYRQDLQEIRSLELVYNDMVKQQRELRDLMQVLPPDISSLLRSQSIELNNNIRTMSTRIDDLNGALDSRAAQYVYPAQLMYIANYLLEIEVEVALQELQTLERELENTRLKFSRGLATTRDVRDAEKKVDDQQDLIKTKRDSVSDNLEDLAKHFGLDSIIELEGLPELDFDLIIERDLEADLEAFIQASTIVEEKILEEALSAYKKNNSAVYRYARDNARADLEKAKQDAEADFPKVYEALRDAYDDYIDSVLVTDMQADYDLLVSQYERGLISRKTLLEMGMYLEIVKYRYEQQRIQLLMTLLEYEFGLIKFIIVI